MGRSPGLIGTRGGEPAASREAWGQIVAGLSSAAEEITGAPRARVLMGEAMAAPYAMTRTPWTVVTWLKGAVWTVAPRAAAQWAYAI